MRSILMVLLAFKRSSPYLLRHTYCTTILYDVTTTFQRPLIRDLTIPQEGLWSYIDIYDLAESIVMVRAAQSLTAP